MKLEHCAFRVDSIGGQPQGTGFVVSPTLAVTCVHGVEAEEQVQESCLLPVASSRARDALTITSYGVPSPSITELGAEGHGS